MTNEFKGTPGLWYVVNAGKHWNNQKITNWQIQYGGVGECISDHVYGEANAHLIAAAPDLLEALQNLVQLKEWKDRNGKDEHYEKSQPIAWDAARAAISKALNQEV